MYEKFKVIVNGVEDYRAYVTCPTNLLTNTIPEGVEGGTVVLAYDAEGNPTETRQKTLSEFVGIFYGRAHWILPDGNVLFKLASIDRPVTRRDAVTADDLMLWAAYLPMYGDYGPETWITEAEQKELIQTLTEAMP